MPDVFTQAKRSAVMAAIRGSGNKDTKLRMVALFRAHGITGWRRNTRVFGKPDFVFRREHGCPRHATMPAKNRAFWKAKLSRNAQRGHEVTRVLRSAGWKVLRVWECALVRARAGQTLARVVRALGRGCRTKDR